MAALIPAAPMAALIPPALVPGCQNDTKRGEGFGIILVHLWYGDGLVGLWYHFGRRAMNGEVLRGA